MASYICKCCVFTLIAVVEVLAMLLIGLRIPDTDILMRAGSARLIYVVFSNLIQIPLVVLLSHFCSRKENVLRILWLLPIIVIQIASIAVCYVVQYHAADENFPDYLIGLMVVLLLMNILIVFYVEALRKNEQEKFRAEFNEQQYRLQMEYYQQLKERQEETRALWHDIKKYILAMQAVAERGNSEELHKIVRDATDAFERSKIFLRLKSSCGRTAKSVFTYSRRKRHQSYSGRNDSRSSIYISVIFKHPDWKHIRQCN